MRPVTALAPLPLNPEITAYWTMWGTIATAIVTGVLAYFAWKAWKAALATIQGQKDSAEIASLTEYMKALLALSRVEKSTPAAFMPPPIDGSPVTRNHQMWAAYPSYVAFLTQEVELSGSIWRAHHRHTGEMNREFQEAEQTLIESQTWRLEFNKNVHEPQSIQFDRSSKFAKDLVDLASRWQVDPIDREDVNTLVESECAKFIEESPCRPILT